MKGIVVRLSPQHNVYHCGYLISAAAAAGAEFQLDAEVSPLTPLFDAAGITVAVDCYDSPIYYEQATLERCSVYLKRSYVAESVPAGFAGKVRPYGLNYSCRTFRSIAVVARLMAIRRMKPEGLRPYLQSPSPEDFESAPGGKPDERILYNTRLWPQDQAGPNDDAEAINGFRIGLTRQLRKAFGERFVGGIIPSSEAYECYPGLKNEPELVVNTPYRRTAYARFAKGPAIGIYTRGLHGSNAFKEAEYLASSKCIIGESLAHQVPEPLGECHRVRNDVDGIVAECDRMLTHPKQLDEIRRLSWHYYQQYIRYDRRMDVMFTGTRQL
jgi:hypothetical protein